MVLLTKALDFPTLRANLRRKAIGEEQGTEGGGIKGEEAPPSPKAAVRPGGLRLYVLNLWLLITLGLLLSGWVLYFTDSFPVVGGLLGLGGLFAWIVFLSGILRNERKEEMQVRFEALVLCRHATWLAVLGNLGSFCSGAPLEQRLPCIKDPANNWIPTWIWPLGRPRTVLAAALMQSSIFTRRNGLPDYRPRNIPMSYAVVP